MGGLPCELSVQQGRTWERMKKRVGKKKHTDDRRREWRVTRPRLDGCKMEKILKMRTKPVPSCLDFLNISSLWENGSLSIFKLCFFFSLHWSFLSVISFSICDFQSPISAQNDSSACKLNGGDTDGWSERLLDWKTGYWVTDLLTAALIRAENTACEVVNIINLCEYSGFQWMVQQLIGLVVNFHFNSRFFVLC